MSVIVCPDIGINIGHISLMLRVINRAPAAGLPPPTLLGDSPAFLNTQLPHGHLGCKGNLEWNRTSVLLASVEQACGGSGAGRRPLF